ncbi:MAG TPA: hypothetical protein VKV02_03950, partial [Acidobacteriaceae bacterium]|nr:hypothetical protein [Acidobacteriaceae bacterium]
RAGRALVEIGGRPTASPTLPGSQTMTGTIACVSGFLISMVQRTIKLISPCEASTRWPLGYIVFAEQTFSSAEEFRDALYRMVDRFMPEPLHGHESLSFHDFLVPSSIPDGLRLSGRHYRTEFAEDPLFSSLAHEIASGSRTVDEIADALASQLHRPPADVYYAVGLLMDQGLLGAQPAGSGQRWAAAR